VRDALHTLLKKLKLSLLDLRSSDHGPAGDAFQDQKNLILSFIQEQQVELTVLRNRLKDVDE